MIWRGSTLGALGSGKTGELGGHVVHTQVPRYGEDDPGIRTRILEFGCSCLKVSKHIWLSSGTGDSNSGLHTWPHLAPALKPYSALG